MIHEFPIILFVCILGEIGITNILINISCLKQSRSIYFAHIAGFNGYIDSELLFSTVIQNPRLSLPWVWILIHQAK